MDRLWRTKNRWPYGSGDLVDYTPSPPVPQVAEPVKAGTPESRAVKRTIAVLIFPVVGEANWIAFLIWAESQVAEPHGMLFGLGLVLGTPAWAGISYGVWRLYRFFLEDEGGKKAPSSY